jgi:hypothetical protein
MEFHNKKGDTLYQAFTRKYLTQPSRMTIGDAEVPVPSASYNALYVFMHAWHHFESSGVGFRQLADWALCLHQAHIQATPEDWQDLCNEIDAILTTLHLKTAWQTFGHVLVNHLHLPAEAFPLYTMRYQKRADRLFRQLLLDGHCGRPAAFSFKEISLMRYFDKKRPNANRLLQIVYTGIKLLFEACQMAKLFPTLAWNELKATMLHSIKKK